jgi:molybdopterin molybdotransferase
MIPVAEALARILALAQGPAGSETVPLRRALGRVLARPVIAGRDQPPFDASAMDGYAVAGQVLPGETFTVIGQSRAGAAFAGRLAPGQALRIFTGAPVPPGASRVVIQEDVTREGDLIRIGPAPDTARHIRHRGGDFRAGSVFEGPGRLGPAAIGLLAAMNTGEVDVIRRPVFAVLPTGDELVPPGGEPGPDQIISSNGHALAALIEARGAEAQLLPIAADRPEALAAAFDLAGDADAVITIGGASVGDHDLVMASARGHGFIPEFWTVAMRPGKPLIAGRLAGRPFIGLPGNPASALVCGHVFLWPLIDAMLGLRGAALPRESGLLTAPLSANGPREHYLRAGLARGARGNLLTPRSLQDSSLISVLAGAGALIVQPPHGPALAEGEAVEFIAL